jgi:hypothetical protein
MKKAKINNKLTLNKKTIAHLRGNEMEAVNGGDSGTCPSIVILCYKTQFCTQVFSCTCPAVCGASAPVC